LWVNRNPSDFFITFCLLLVIIPSLVMYVCAGYAHKFLAITMVAFSILVVVTRVVKFRAVRICRISPGLFLILAGVISVLTLAAIVAISGTKYFNLDLSKVYQFRRGAASELPAAFGYLNSIVTTSVVPFAVVFSVMHKKWIAAIVFVFVAFFFFAFTAHKAPLFMPIVVLFIYYMAKGGRFTELFVWALFLTVVVSIVEVVFSFYLNKLDFVFFTGTVPRRILMVPALLNWQYIEYFSAHDVYVWSHSRISFGALNTPSDLPMPKIIGYEYYNDPDTNANTGWIGAGFGQGRYYGVILYSIGIGLLLKLFDAFAELFGKRAVIAILFIPTSVIFSSSDFFTTLLTHGMLVSIVLLASVSYQQAPRLP